MSHHCFKLGWTDDNKRFAEYRSEVIAVASQAVMDNRIVVSLSVRIPARNFAMVPTKFPYMFSGRVETHPCSEFKAKFPNLYLEPMQYNNPNGKWQEEIPYMIINLEYDKDIYLGKDTIVAYVWEEDNTCEYLEVNEIVELEEFRNWTSKKSKSSTESDSVFSPAQVTEHCCVELKDQDIHKKPRRGSKNLRRNIQRSFCNPLKLVIYYCTPYVLNHILSLLYLSISFIILISMFGLVKLSFSYILQLRSMVV